MHSTTRDYSSNAKEYFQFDSDYLLAFCERFQEIPIEDQTESVLEVKIKDLDLRWNRFQSSYEAAIMSRDESITPQIIQDIKDRYNVCSDAYYNCYAQMLDAMRMQRMDQPAHPRFQSTTRDSIPAQQFTYSANQHDSSDYIKLPPCDTEIFNGSYEQWPSFRDMFTAVYINHSKLAPVTKLYHLRNKTRGEAGAIVKRYPLSHDNFDIAWNALKTRYENKRVLVDNQIKILFDIPAAKGEDSESLRRIQSSVNDSLATLQTLGVDVESWNPILIRLVSTKLPDHTLALWEQSLTSPRELPEWSQMSQFLVDRYEAVERLTSIRKSKEPYFSHKTQHKVQTYVSQENLTLSCKLCNEKHSLRECSKFRDFNVQQRLDFVFQNKICNNCLAISHLKVNCKSKHTCLHCKKQHHTLLHIGPKTSTSIRTSEDSQNIGKLHSQDIVPQKHQNNIRHDKDYMNEPPSTSRKVHANCSTSSEQILLRTALVQVELRGDIFTLRARIDPGSQRTFLSEKIRNRLQIPYLKSHFEVIGIGGQKQIANKECELTLYARRHNLRIPIKAIILPKMTKCLPSHTFQLPKSHDLSNLDLADPTFNKSSQIDLILGNDYEQFLNINGIKKNICGKASAYNTIFGWVLSGPISTQTIQTFSTYVSTDISDLKNLLRKFWEQEEIPVTPQRSPEDEFCEKYFTQTTTRNENGRYMVRLPFKPEYPDKLFLGSSRFIALAQYSSMEKTLAKNPDLHDEYIKILNEYVSLDHMEETSANEIIYNGRYNSFYLPHHAVVRPEHKTTKVRIVFNASRKSKSKFSLNDVLCTGPTLQNDLMSIILNWRKYQYVFSGDIQKMYRQILVHPEDRPYQRILFQPHKESPIKDYQLKTVTFGVNCAPYLAIRTLNQLALESADTHPRGADILRNETYVDDILSGGHSLEETSLAQTQTIEILKSAGFPLKKITANNSQLLNHIEKESLYDSEFLQFHDTSSTKTLGIKWNALTDEFTYSFATQPQTETITKRQTLSSVAKLFDPAGWLAPIIIRSKIFMQQLWLEGLEWDDNIPPESLEKWIELTEDLPEIENITIPRGIKYSPKNSFQIHGFSDASKSAFCATIYIRCQDSTGKMFANLLAAKSKVAPIQTISLPRLELNGALLLANLVNHIVCSLKLEPEQIYLWTDSTITLSWLSKPPSSWETYVANRISRIHTLLPNAIWRHVPTNDNPADLGTRGCKPLELAKNSIWWHGPLWLTEPILNWPRKYISNIIVKPHESISLNTQIETTDLLNNFSSYSRAMRVICYVFRFFHRCLPKEKRHCIESSDNNLTQKELKFVKQRLIILAQRTFYKDEYEDLLNSKVISNKSTLKTLNPFMDSVSILRVNGRLAQSCLPYNERYPIILPGNSRFCHLYLDHLHKFLFHADFNLMCRMIQTEFYISRLKPRIRKLIHSCKTCLIHKKQSNHQIMAPLPPERCNLSLTFQTTGIDFAGPFEIKSSPLRKAPTTKGYVSVFICFSTKAVHLEPCSELSSAAFQAAFARFVGRRGLPQRVVTDNGRNFLGASRALEEEFSAFVKEASQDIAQKYITHGFEWKFIPPHAPHMGGLWEAAVKSFKYHFKRVIGAQKLTFEEFYTVLTRIEGILNSRPISALSEDPMDLTALTPGHFLKGAPLLAFPEQNCENLSILNRWEKLKAMHHQFSLRWKTDYLTSLHKRYKWKDAVPNLKPGDLVVVMDDLLPPHDWRSSQGCKRCSKKERNPHDFVCALCNRVHGLRFCHRFLKMSVKKREDVVEKYGYCVNCLAKSHDLRSCISMDMCRKCDRFHHTLLHPSSDRPKRIKTRKLRHHQHKRQHQHHRQPAKRTETKNQHKAITSTATSADYQPQTSKPSRSQQTTLTAAPDAKVIVDAIRSLANILCVTNVK